MEDPIKQAERMLRFWQKRLDELKSQSVNGVNGVNATENEERKEAGEKEKSPHTLKGKEGEEKREEKETLNPRAREELFAAFCTQPVGAQTGASVSRNTPAFLNSAKRHASSRTRSSPALNR